eukprot:CAMPEP_0171063406 /NCGR_PEP_ID=MMETSP0766_2-20121228/5638_1 /TAXON_ID=439317 /ORGANISM="Gambierdiscus australes, Strain CAWD 149" /LENGTH=33 /DNA_ID= /DNA_START= /DNA_END= /DNA_ORIENTATION=
MAATAKEKTCNDHAIDPRAQQDRNKYKYIGECV